MRALIMAVSVAVAASFAIAEEAVARTPALQTGVLPHDGPTLRALDNAHLRIVRRARSLCWHSGFGFRGRGAASRACIIGETESAIANSKDPVLQAYHKYLPFHARYDEYRPAFYWQRLVQA
jgi:hypothetical protein